MSGNDAGRERHEQDGEDLQLLQVRQRKENAQLRQEDCPER